MARGDNKSLNAARNDLDIALAKMRNIEDRLVDLTKSVNVTINRLLQAKSLLDLELEDDDEV